MFFSKSLRIKILLSALIPMALVLVVVAIIALYAYERAARDLVQQRDTELASISAARLSEALTARSRVFRRMLDEGNLQSMDPGRMMSTGLEEVRPRLALFDAGVVVYNSEGAAVWSEPLEVKSRWADFPLPLELDKMRRTLRLVFSDIFEDPGSREDVILVGMPIISEGSEFKGVLAGMCTIRYSLLGATYAQVLEFKAGRSGYAYLVDGNGRVIYHRHSSQLGRNLAASVAVMQVTRGEAGAVLTEDSTGESVVSGFAPVPGTNWGVVTQERWANVVGPIRGYGRLLLGLLVVGGIISSAL
ncbi:MAG: cache domain-containing protein, partial [Planctomycetes bacterium]|nr:cache domain-containing protein [Planctomycetota bacterium]